MLYKHVAPLALRYRNLITLNTYVGDVRVDCASRAHSRASHSEAATAQQWND